MEQIKQDYKLLTDFWHFWKSHSNIKPLDNDPYWEGLIDDANAFAASHPEPYAVKLVVSLMKEFERRMKECSN